MSENLFGLTVAADKGLDDLQCQRLLSENRRYQEVMLQYRCALKALESRLEILKEEFSLQHDRNPIESMKSRLKSPSSIMNKMQKRGLPLDFPTMQANIMDIAGVRVICSFEEDVFFLAKCLKNQSDIEIITEKDYISHPKPNGYRSLHLTIRLAGCRYSLLKKRSVCRWRYNSVQSLWTSGQALSIPSAIRKTCR